MADGAYRWQGHAPAPDLARVDAVEAAFDDAQVEAFGEPTRAGTVARLEQALAAARTGDMTEAAAQLNHARALLAGLRPETLEPRRGLAGLFDSRKGRLDRFRDAYAHAAASLADVASDLSGRIEGAAQRSGTLDALWADLRDALADLDVYLAAATRRLTGHTPMGDAAVYPLDARKTALDACRAAALGALPLIRSVQGTDARSAAALKTCAEGVAAWRKEWTEALGLSGKRPKKVRPEPGRLLRQRDDLLARIDRALAELPASGARRAEITGRLTALRRPL